MFFFVFVCEVLRVFRRKGEEGEEEDDKEELSGEWIVVSLGICLFIEVFDNRVWKKLIDCNVEIDICGCEVMKCNWSKFVGYEWCKSEIKVEIEIEDEFGEEESYMSVVDDFINDIVGGNEDFDVEWVFLFNVVGNLIGYEIFEELFNCVYNVEGGLLVGWKNCFVIKNVFEVLVERGDWNYGIVDLSIKFFEV